MAMVLIFGTVQGLESAQRFAAERFGALDRLSRAPRAHWQDRRHPADQSPEYKRFLAGALEPADFDGHVVAVDDMGQGDGERLRYVDLERDGATDTMCVDGDILIVPGMRMVWRWLPVGRWRKLVEIWADLNEFENPIVTKG